MKAINDAASVRVYAEWEWDNCADMETCDPVGYREQTIPLRVRK
jgi:hypothetical protein